MDFSLGTLGHFLGDTLLGAIICMAVTFVIVYLNMRKIGKLEISFEERQQRVIVFEKQLKLVGLVLALLVLTGLLRQSSGYMIIVSLFLSQTLIEMSRNKVESLFGKQK